MSLQSKSSVVLLEFSCQIERKQRTERRLPCSQRLSFILYWEILLSKPLFLFFFFYWHEALRALKASGRDRWEPHFHAISF